MGIQGRQITMIVAVLMVVMVVMIIFMGMMIVIMLVVVMIKLRVIMMMVCMIMVEPGSGRLIAALLQERQRGRTPRRPYHQRQGQCFGQIE